MTPDAGESHASVRALFLRGIGLVYLIAFVSLHAQVEGLFGSGGLAPIAELMGQLRERIGGTAFLRLPTLFWFDDSNASLVLLCRLGVLSSALLLLGILPLPAALACWLLYLSFVVVGAPFLRFQWDSLLLEAGFLALLWAPATATLRSARATTPSVLVLWLIRILVFRLMFLSGFVKLASGDPSWWDLTALTWHWWTQPLPAWTAWYAAQLPLFLQQLACAVVFFIELVMPFAILLGARGRLAACTAFVGLMVMIGATGNYGFFNLLTAVLCIPLLRDSDLPGLLRQPRANAAAGSKLRGVLTAVAAFLILAQSVPTALARVTGWSMPLGLVREAILPLSGPFQLTSSYGLFAAMTKRRPEVILEATRDGKIWEPYVFRWKPGPPSRPPGFVGFGMPRLDWQLWFDALAIRRAMDHRVPTGNIVLPELIARLEAADPAVLGLLESSPFGSTPPQAVRWQLPQYRFTTAEEREATGDWWHVSSAE